MKKCVILISLVFFCVQAASADWFTLGLNAGYRNLDDRALGEIYGDGYVYEPYIRYSFERSLSLELSYEGGYKRNGPVGFFQEDSTLSVTGFPKFISCASVMSAHTLKSASPIIFTNRISIANSSGSKSIIRNGRPLSAEG